MPDRFGERGAHEKREVLGYRVDGNGLLAGLAPFMAFTLQTIGIGLTTASNAAFITGLAVVFTPMFAFFLLKIRVSRQQAAGVTMAAIGLAMLTLDGLSLHRGDLLVLGCAVFTALHIVVLSRSSKGGDIEVLAFVQVMVVALLSLLWSWLEATLRWPGSPRAVSTILVMGVVGTAIGYFVQTTAQVRSAPSTIALVLVLAPVFGGIFGYALGGDRLSTVNLVGAVVIVVAMIVTEAKPRAVAAVG